MLVGGTGRLWMGWSMVFGVGGACGVGFVWPCIEVLYIAFRSVLVVSLGGSPGGSIVT